MRSSEDLGIATPPSEQRQLAEEEGGQGLAFLRRLPLESAVHAFQHISYLYSRHTCILISLDTLVRSIIG
jgi:hypothetical protein